MTRKLVTLALFILSFGTLGLFSASRVFAADQVVTNCSNDSELRADLTAMQGGGGGTLTFNCGMATIVLSNSLPAINATTTIDGANKIALSGGNNTRLLHIASGKTLTLTNIVIQNGYMPSGDAGGDGGAVYVQSNATLNATNVIFQNNKAAQDGGAIYAYDSTLNLTSVTLSNNYAEDDGGAIYALRSTLTLNNVNMVSNSAADYSGALSNDQSAVTWTVGEMSYNNATIAGGMDVYTGASDGTSTLTNVTVTNNHANNNEGGAFYVFTDATLRLTNSTLSKNTANNGGGIYNNGASFLTNTTFNLNSATNGNGGAIFTQGTATLTNVTLSDNTATSKGGGIYILQNLTTLTNATLRGNSALNGGSVYFQGGGHSLKNTLIAKGPNGANCVGLTGGSFNLSDDNSCGFGAGRDNINLKLGPLANNGGLTQTHLPQAGSPAINGGTNSGCPSTDQRGVARPQSGTCDAGSVEVQPATPTPAKTATKTPTKTATRTPTRTPTLAVCGGKPAKPQLVKPQNGKKAKGPRVKLGWNAANCATSYAVVVRVGAKNGTKVFQKKNMTALQGTTGALTPGQIYFWRVTAKNANGSTKSDWFQFKVK